MVTDSGGAGRHRGGLSTQRTLKTLNTPITGSQMSDRHYTHAWGLNGGSGGGLAGTWHMAANTTEWATIADAFGKISPSKWSNVTIAPGDRVRFQTPGGGGWGNPGERPKELVKNDLDEGYISAQQAHEVYGLDVISGEN